jgi:hypothetical protein
MAKARKKPRGSWFKRMLYLIVLVSGGSSGWLFKDHPTVQAAWNLLTGQPVPDGASAGKDVETTLATEVAAFLKSPDQFNQPGTYQVTIPKVHLDSHLFRVGQTVDIQARVLKVDPQGRSTTLWETKAYGEQLAVAGKDDLIAGWPQRPFQVEWNPGERLVVEVSGRRTGLFVEPRNFVLSPSDSEPREFPLKPGSFSLESAQKLDGSVDPRNNNIVLQSQRVGTLQGDRTAEAPGRREAVGLGSRAASPQGDDDTIVIK